MEEQAGSDLRINGSTTVTGGTFNRVTISGQGEINGDLDCNEFKISGSSDVRGNLKAGTVRVSGNATVYGDIRAGEVKISGNLSGRGKVTAEKFGVSGSADIAAGLAAEDVMVSGFLATRGGCEAESFVARGAVNIRGMLNAENIDIKQYGGRSRAGEIGGEKISIRVPGPLGLQKILRLFHTTGKFVAETIEADDVYLEYTKAGVVRRNNVFLGPGCEIELVEYRDVFQQDKDAVARDHKKVIPQNTGDNHVAAPAAGKVD